MKRHISYSEGYLLETDFPIEFNKKCINELLLENSTDISKISVSSDDKTSEPIIHNKQKYFIIIYNKILAFMIHLLLIATFEIIFFTTQVLLRIDAEYKI